jgi:sterol 14-demethylase
MLKKLWATKQIYDIIVRAIDQRQRSGVSKSDTLQMLLDEQDERMVIVGVSFPFEMAFRSANISTVHYGSAGRWREGDWNNCFVAHHISWRP